MEHEALIAKLARTLYKNTHLYDLEDLFQVGLQSAVRLNKKFDPTRSKITTFYTICIRRDMLTYINKHKKNFSDNPLMNPVTIDPEHIWEYLPDLTDREQSIVDHLLDGFTKKEVREKLKAKTTEIQKVMSKIRKTIGA